MKDRFEASRPGLGDPQLLKSCHQLVWFIQWKATEGVMEEADIRIDDGQRIVILSQRAPQAHASIATQCHGSLDEFSSIDHVLIRLLMVHCTAA